MESTGSEFKVPFYLNQWFIIAVLALPAVLGFLAYQVYNSSLLPLRDGDYSCIDSDEAARIDNGVTLPTLHAEDLAATVEGGEVESVWTFRIVSRDGNPRGRKVDVAYENLEQVKINRFTVTATSPIGRERKSYVCKKGHWSD